ncbi:MAG: hypothetical protein ACP5I8_06825 [Phycisphaerae bacterium]
MNAQFNPDTQNVKSTELSERHDVVRSLLEEDQLVAFKQRTRFGRRQFSPGLKILLWALRLYVVIMLIIVIVQIIRTVR